MKSNTVVFCKLLALVTVVKCQKPGSHGNFVRISQLQLKGGIGDPCTKQWRWNPPNKNMGTRDCDQTRGFSCQSYPAYGGWVCACQSYFSYDPHSNECRRRLNGTCPHPDLQTQRQNIRQVNSLLIQRPYRPAAQGQGTSKPTKARDQDLQWFDKCQENAECALTQAFKGRKVGKCFCKPGFRMSYGGDFCE